MTVRDAGGTAAAVLATLPSDPKQVGDVIAKALDAVRYVYIPPDADPEAHDWVREQLKAEAVVTA